MIQPGRGSHTVRLLRRSWIDFRKELVFLGIALGWDWIQVSHPQIVEDRESPRWSEGFEDENEKDAVNVAWLEDEDFKSWELHATLIT